MEITQSLVKELFDYREDGFLVWNKKPSKNRKSGDVAGCKRTDGYVRVKVRNKYHYLHRLIFIYHHGYLSDVLDHIDGNPSNNKIENLRVATKQQNAVNRGKGKNNSSLYKGVSENKKNKSWVASICIDGKTNYLGSFKSKEDAAKSYDEKIKQVHGNFAKTNFQD